MCWAAGSIRGLVKKNGNRGNERWTFRRYIDIYLSISLGDTVATHSNHDSQCAADELAAFDPRDALTHGLTVRGATLALASLLALKRWYDGWSTDANRHHEHRLHIRSEEEEDTDWPPQRDHHAS